MRSESIEWGDYIGFDPGVDKPLAEVTRAEARDHFERFMRALPERPEMLRQLLERNGVTLQEGDAGLDTLNDWFSDHLEGDPETVRMESWWYVVALDIGIWMGEEMIRRWPQLEWRLFTAGKRDVSYQRPVIMGFNTRNKNFNYDPELMVVGLGERVLMGERDPGYLKMVVNNAKEYT